MDELSTDKKYIKLIIENKMDVKLLIENEIQKFIDNSSSSLMVFQNTYRPLSILEINDFMRLMIDRYSSHKVRIRSIIDPENFTVNITLEKI